MVEIVEVIIAKASAALSESTERKKAEKSAPRADVRDNKRRLARVTHVQNTGQRLVQQGRSTNE
jgi:hypothetical protein